MLQLSDQVTPHSRRLLIIKGLADMSRQGEGRD